MIARIACGHPKACGITGFNSSDICSRYSMCAADSRIVSVVVAGTRSSSAGCKTSFRDMSTLEE